VAVRVALSRETMRDQQQRDCQKQSLLHASYRYG
jgi:hypothetical protein